MQALSITEKIAETLFPVVRERRNLLERRAETNPLTGLPNRRAFDLAEPQARLQGLAFILFDLNNFGCVNKTLGHKKGDQLLCYYADVQKKVAHNYKARLFHFGGDEFLIVCTFAFAFRVRDAVESRADEFRFDGFTVSISGEIGTSVEDCDERLQARKAERKNVQV